jgi:flavin-dependent dehydrogenase
MTEATGSVWDAVVVGGRIAGALAAARLAGQGRRVLVLDASGVNSGTASTHFFRGDGLVRSLAELDLLEAVLAVGAPPLRGQRFYLPGADDAPSEEAPEPGDAGFCLSVRRETLDPLLARLVAARPGVGWLARRRVTGVLRDGDRVVGVRDNAGADHQAALVVGADGRRSTIARLVRAQILIQSEPRRFMGYAYVRNWASRNGVAEVESSLCDNELAYVFPSDGGLACAAVTVPIADAPTSGGRRWLTARMCRHPALFRRYAEAEPVGRFVRVTPTREYVRQAAGPGWALVGDAGTHQDPWAGFGMDTAARQAAGLAAAVAEHGPGSDAMAQAYTDARDAVTLQTYLRVTETAGDLSVLAD